MADERARRMKSLLEGFYGHGRNDSDDGISKAAAAIVRDDINVKGFDADYFVGNMIRNSRLDDLLQQHVTWAAEIKNLDSDMQMLVYENYSKFISATDTIKKMQEDVVNMEESIEKLLSSMSNIQQQSDKINLSLLERRGRIEELNGTRSLLRKVEYIFDLPRRLRDFVNQKKFAAAVAAYQGALPVLESYGDSSFKACKQEAAEVMAGVIPKLQALVMSESISFEERAEASTFLQQMNYPIEQLMDEYLAASWQRLTAQLQEAADMAAQTGDKPKALQNFVDALKREFLDDFERTASHFRGIFPMGEAKLVEATGSLFSEYLASFQALIHPEADASLSAAELVKALERLSSDIVAMNELVPEANIEAACAETFEVLMKEHITQSFALLEMRICESFQALPKSGSAASSKVPAQSHGGRGLFSSVLETAEAHVVTGTLQLLEDLSHVLETSVPFLSAAHDDCLLLINTELSLLFSSLHAHFLALTGLPLPPAAATSAAGSEVAASNRRTAISPLISQLPSPLSSPPHAALVLLLARLSLFMQHAALPKIADVIAVQNQTLGGGGLRIDDDVSIDQSLLFSPGSIGPVFQAASERLLQLFVDVASRKLDQMIRKGVGTPNWIRYKEPKDVRMVVDLLLQEFDSLFDVVSQLLDSSSEKFSSARRRGSATSRSSTLSPGSRGDGGSRDLSSRMGGGGSSGSLGAAGIGLGKGGVAGVTRMGARGGSRLLEQNMAKLFAQKVQVVTKLEFTQESVMTLLVRGCLKSFQELVRLETFNRAGYQQIQLDALFLCETLRSFVEDESLVDTMLDEVFSAASERSLDPTPMDATTMDQIIQKKRKKTLLGGISTDFA